jgi:hypothetical protein
LARDSVTETMADASLRVPPDFSTSTLTRLTEELRMSLVALGLSVKSIYKNEFKKR